MNHQQQQPPDMLSSISSFYGMNFPESIKASLEQWIKQRLQNVQLDQQLPAPIFEQEAVTFFNDLIAELEQSALNLPPESVQLEPTLTAFRRVNPLQLYTTLIELLQTFRQSSEPPSVDQQVLTLQELTCQSEEKLRVITQITPTQREPATLELLRDLWTILDHATLLANQIIGTFLRQWRIQQDCQQATSDMLDTIQTWCEALVGAIWSVRNQLQTVPALVGDRIDLSELNHRTRDLLAVLATKGFVVERQPPQVVKTSTKYPVAIRHLLGGQLRSRMTSLQLQTSIVSELQARSIQQSNVVTNENSGELGYDDGEPKFREDPTQLAANFRLQIKRIKRPERRGAESVTDEKFALLFHLTFIVGDLSFSVWTISQPLVVVVHGNQEPQGWATIVWDSAFADPSRIPFEVSDRMPWNLLGEMLNRKFTSFMERPLTEENLHFLGEKATKRTLPYPITTDQLITRGQFSREIIPSRSFTFWEWFYAAMKVTRDYLKDIWRNGHMVGFIAKSRTEALLTGHPPGTFLLRFSDSQTGGITIAYVTSEPATGPRVQHINPFFVKDAVNLTRYLMDKIRDLPQLKFVYPGVPKEQAFGKYFQPVVVAVDGYVPAVPAAPAENESGEASGGFAEVAAGLNGFQHPELLPMNELQYDGSFAGPPAGFSQNDLMEL